MSDQIFQIGEYVWCTENGVRGHVQKIYKPTACKEQLLIETDDGKGKYHAPISLWKRYLPGPQVFGLNTASVIVDEYASPWMAEHNKYLQKFADNHGLTIEEAQQQPMISAHMEFCKAMERGHQMGLRSATD